MTNEYGLPFIALGRGWGACIAWLTPELATRLLQHNRENNRNLKRKKVAEIRGDIRAESYHLNGQTVAVSPSGLEDGQHRCQAVVAEGRPVETLFVWMPEDAVPDARLSQDRGSPRTIGDQLKTLGEDPKQSAVLGQLYDHLHGTRTQGRGSAYSAVMSATAAADFRREIREVGLDASFAEAMDRGTRIYKAIQGSRATYQTFMFLALQADEDRAVEFARQLEGYDLTPHNPVDWFRKLIQERDPVRQTFNVQRAAAVWPFLVKTWNDWLDGKTWQTKRTAQNRMRPLTTQEPFPRIQGLPDEWKFGARKDEELNLPPGKTPLGDLLDRALFDVPS